MSGLTRRRRSVLDRKLVAAFTAARIGYALAVMVTPRRMGRPWLGDAVDLSGGRVAARALVARDAALSVGFGLCAWHGAPARPWLAAIIASDTADLVSTVLDPDDLPRQAVPGVIAAAGGMALAGIALYRAAED